VWLATGPTDMRRGMNGLAIQVQETRGVIRTTGTCSSFAASAATARQYSWQPECLNIL
jgi:hypothetical protein